MKSFPKIAVFVTIVGLALSCSSEKKSEQELFAEAQAYSEKSDFNDAIRIYRRILKLYPESQTSHRALLLMGLVYSQNLKDDKQAETIFQKFVEKYPDGEKLLYDEAQSLSEKGDFNAAIKIYEEILKLYSESANSCRAQFLIGFVYSENLKDYEKAKEVYKEILEKYPDCDLADDARFMLELMASDSLPGDSTE